MEQMYFGVHHLCQMTRQKPEFFANLLRSSNQSLSRRSSKWQTNRHLSSRAESAKQEKRRGALRTKQKNQTNIQKKTPRRRRYV